jgi:alkylhydroperoxidase family enzyme
MNAFQLEQVRADILHMVEFIDRLREHGATEEQMQAVREEVARLKMRAAIAVAAEMR